MIKDEFNANEGNLYQSDLVKMALEIPYMPQDARDIFKFDKDSYDKILELAKAKEEEKALKDKENKNSLDKV